MYTRGRFMLMYGKTNTVLESKIKLKKKGGKEIGLESRKQCFSVSGDSLVTWTIKHLPAMQETWVQSLGREDPLEKEIATHSSILAWRIPWTEKPGRL